MVSPATPPDSQLWKSAGFITTTRPTMAEWLVPQYWPQKRWYTPVLVAWNQRVV